MVLSRATVATGVLACVVATVAAGCGDADGGEPTAVAATTSIWADITSNVLCGDDVAALIPAGADPHTFEPSLRDRELIEGAALIVSNGGGLEGSLIDLLTTADDANLVEMTPHIDVIVTEHPDDDHDGDTADDGHGHDLDADPHVWQDPLRVAGALDVIASAGTAIGRSDCSDDYEAELVALDAEIIGLLADIPAERRVMVTSHDSLAYFADRYDLDVVGTVIPSTNTLAQTNAADLAALADLIEANGVRAIFTEELESTADADALARRLGVDVVPLVTDALTDDPTTDTYIEMMRSNATLIAEALTP
jgi:zinc/manganese transport system substrate-binding protein